MSNYYEILGLQPGAGSGEIKAAFRRLAKQYHPDKNPNGKEFFETLLKAYETLSDPQLRSTYDYRLEHNLPQRERTTQKTATKTWKFSEQELKRRQYYNEHIRKYAKATASYNAEADTRKNYNEFKYILYAMPLAVAIFVLIMKLATPERKLSPGLATKNTAREQATIPPPKQGDSPYAEFFSSPVYEASSKRRLNLRNHTGNDIVAFITSDSAFVRSFFMEDGFSAEVMQLPEGRLYLRYSSGKEFDYLKKLSVAGVQGGFSIDQRFYKSSAALAGAHVNELNLLPGKNESFRETDEKDFFNLGTRSDK